MTSPTHGAVMNKFLFLAVIAVMPALLNQTFA